MSDILFQCSNCKTCLCADEVDIGDKILCPRCNTPVMVPPPQFVFSCGYCGQELSATMFLSGEECSCPNCDTRIVVPGLRAELQDLDGKITTTPARQVLKLKNQPGAEKPLQSLTFAQPEVQQRSTFFNFMGQIFSESNVITASKVFIGLGLVLLTIAQVKSGCIQLEDTVVQPELPPPKPIIAPVVDLTPWDNMSSNLAVIKSSPADVVAMSLLSKQINSLSESHDDVRVGLMTVFAISKLKTMRDNGGFIGLDYLKRNHAGSPFIKWANPDRYYDICQFCKGLKESREPCLDCAKTGKCRRCNGVGHIETTRQLTQPKRLVQTQTLGGTKGVKGLGPSPNPAASQQPTEIKEKVQCLHCSGTGKCPTCHGAKNLARPCLICKTQGKTLSDEKISQNLNASINLVTSLIAQKKTRKMEATDKELSGWASAFFNEIDAHLKSKITVLPIIMDGSEYSLFDAILLSCLKHDIKISIDPEIMDQLANIKIKDEVATAVTNAKELEDLIAKHGLIIKDAPINDSTKVKFITSPSIWAYSLACWYISQGDLQGASQSLASTIIESNRYGVHGRALRGILNEAANTQKELATLEREVMKAASAYQFTAKSADMIASASTTGLKGTERSHLRSAAHNASQNAQREARNAMIQLDSFIDKVLRNNTLILERYTSTADNYLFTESYFLLDNVIQNFSKLKKILLEVDKVGLTSFTRYGKWCTLSVPDVIADIQAIVLEKVTQSRGKINNNSDISLENAKSYDHALAMDKANLMARVGAGYYKVLQHVDSLHATLYTSQNASDPSKITEIGKQFARKNKNNYATAFNNLSDQKVPVTPSEARLGAVAGTAVIGLDGVLFPMSVRIVPRETYTYKERTLITDDQMILFGRVMAHYHGTSYYSEKEYELKASLVSFGDYGKKDVSMERSAYEVHKWLSGQYDQEMSNKSIRIDFHDLSTTKAGDSAGVAMAVGGYSFLRKTPVKTSVAMTGSIRSDGTVKAVGGIQTKVQGAMDAETVETIIIPRENRTDALLIPLDQLCRIAIITADNIQTYIEYATTDMKDDALANLRKAQILLLMNYRSDSRKILEELVKTHPEIYSAYRLLEVIAIHERKLAKAGG